MNKILKYSLIILLGLFLPGFINAQTGEWKNSTSEQKAEFQTKRMQKELALDTSIVEDVHEINLRYAYKMEKIQNMWC